MLLLVGVDSEIATATCRHLQSLGQELAGTTRRADRLAPDRFLLDLAAPLDDWQPPEGVEAACIFAAVARLATCAADPLGSARINVDQTLALIDRLTADGIHVLFLSTNQVFDGAIPHVPPDAPRSPISEYGRQKARTEAALEQRMGAGAPIGILRLAKVVSPEMALLRGWTAALREGKPIRAFSDMHMAPTPIALVAPAIAMLLNERARGIFQLTGPRDVSYFEIGARIAARLGVSPALVEAVPAASAGMPEGATPRHTTLDSSVLARRYGLTVPDVWAVLDPIIAG